MLLEFACSNHKSIRGEVLFSALAGKDNTFEEKTKEIPGGRVLKSAIIYGANGAGKSNLVNAIAFVKDIDAFASDLSLLHLDARCGRGCCGSGAADMDGGGQADQGCGGEGGVPGAGYDPRHRVLRKAWRRVF